ncbi:hypothetical protein F4808DRAFT_443565 [Astrocystis sublimbata]|nr:hypothetical protein F4808DRAFT_443565 [Astrocystis sublimbata]
MEPLSVTASVIAVAGLVTQSAKAVYGVIDGLAEAPQAIAQSKTLLTGTQNSLDTLIRTLSTNRDVQMRFEPALQSIKLDRTLTSTRELCDKFKATLTKYTSHSTESRLSNRDRIHVQLHRSQIVQFNDELSGCQETISRVTGSNTQEGGNTAQVAIAVDEQARSRRFATLHETCEAARRVTQAERTGQTFGDMQIDQSRAMQGVVGEVQDGVRQTFGTLSAQNNSRGFQGTMDAASFGHMFG